MNEVKMDHFCLHWFSLLIELCSVLRSLYHFLSISFSTPKQAFGSPKGIMRTCLMAFYFLLLEIYPFIHSHICICICVYIYVYTQMVFITCFTLPFSPLVHASHQQSPHCGPCPWVLFSFLLNLSTPQPPPHTSCHPALHWWVCPHFPC